MKKSMKEERFFEVIAEIDENYIAEARTESVRRSNPVWIKTISIAACICVIIASMFVISYIKQNQYSETLMSKLSKYELNAQYVSNPEFVEAVEMPRITKEDLLLSIQNNLTVQGIIDEIETVRVMEDDTVWYITTATIRVEDVLRGNVESEEVQIVSIAIYKGQIHNMEKVPAQGLKGCKKGTKGVFVLGEPDDTSWLISGKDVYPKSLGEYYIIFKLEKTETGLTFTEQGIELSNDEIHNE